MGQGACHEEVQATLERWGVTGPWFPELDLADGTKVRRSPTRVLGTWVELRLLPDGRSEALRITASMTARVGWSTDCTASLSLKNYEYDEKILSKNYSDRSLGETLKKSKQGLLYAWSPQMPLSERSYASLKKVASELKLPLTLILDPNASLKQAEVFARKNKIPKEGLKTDQSLELLYRGMGEHYPALAVYADGKLIGPVFPGYKNPERYKSFIQAQLNPRGER